jgi:hypothetical protein
MGANPFDSSEEDREAGSFLSGGSLAAQFPEVGFVVEGTVLSASMRDRTDMDTGEVLYWQGNKTIPQSEVPEGAKLRPARQMLLELQCEPTGKRWETNRYVEVAVPDDDGIRTMYVKGGIQKALSKALKEAGNAPVEKGAYVWVQREKDRKLPGSKYYAYAYTAKWTPADQNTKAATAFVNDAPDDDPFA